MNKILVADDHVLVRELISSYIKNATDYDVDVASDYDETIGKIDGDGPYDLVLLDYDMPGMDGLDGVVSVIDHNKEHPVALLSGVVSRKLAEEALQKGAGGIIPKTLHLRSMLAAIDFMLAGEIYASFQFVVTPSMPKGVPLTHREHEVLKCICEGKSNKEIARELGLHETTVKMHVRGVSRKLNAKNRTHAAMIAHEKKLV